MNKSLASLALAFFAPTVAQAGEWHLLELQEFSFEAARIYDNRDPYWNWDGSQREPWADRTAVNFNVDLLTRNGLGLTWNNTIHAETTERQYRTVGWQFETGLRVTNNLELLWHHHSQHLIDATNYTNREFPLQNYVGAKVTFYERKHK